MVQKDFPEQVFLPAVYWLHLTAPERNTQPLLPIEPKYFGAINTCHGRR
jgi:hypothetical protein